MRVAELQLSTSHQVKFWQESLHVKSIINYASEVRTVAVLISILYRRLTLLFRWKLCPKRIQEQLVLQI